MMSIKSADFSDPQLKILLSLHLDEASTQQQSHAFDMAQLQSPDINMFTVQSETGGIMGCAALKDVGNLTGEIKSVRTHPYHLRKGVSQALMEHIEQFAKDRGWVRLYLETHPTPAYGAARALYEGRGYFYCGPFGDYIDSPSSVFMTKEL